MNLNAETIGKFVALGGTYITHQEEDDTPYRWPDVWVVPQEAIINEGDFIRIPERVDKVKPGAELTAVVGSDLWQASEEEAWDGIKGFSVSNDVTASGDWPGWSDPSAEMITGVGYKIFPTFSPILSEMQPKGEIEAYDDLDVRVEVDGEVAVSGSTSQLDFTIPQMVSFASQILELEENDVIALGDPGSPSMYLDDASSVCCYVESIGTLSNPVENL